MNAAPSDIDAAVDSLARTLWGEARGESLAGKQAVAAVVLNRVRRAREHGGRYWWGASITEVCRRPWQFSCWNETDPNRARLEAVGPDNRAFRQCLRVAADAVAGLLDDPTGGATHYHTETVDPPWSRTRTPSARIGRHLFYNDVE